MSNPSAIQASTSFASLSAQDSLELAQLLSEGMSVIDQLNAVLNSSGSVAGGTNVGNPYATNTKADQ